MNTVEEFEAAIKSLTEERDQLTSHYSDAKELIQRMMKEEEVLREERDRLQSDLAAMGTDLGVMTEERDRAHDALTPEEITILGNMLSVMGEWGMFNLPQLHAIVGAVHRILKARASLKPVSDRQPEGEPK